MTGTRSRFDRIREVVRNIPAGRVTTYGQVARMAGLPGAARLVGYALHSLPPDTDVPWHRVINSRGRISPLPDPLGREIQKHLLLSEGILFDADQRVDLDKFLWRPPPE